MILFYILNDFFITKIYEFTTNFQVSDFGLAKYGDYSAEGGKFPIKWTSPEALRDNVSLYKNTNKNCLTFYIY